VHSYDALSDHDFELLAADLFSTSEQARYQLFPRGPDLGVDLRHDLDDGRADIIQCKHYLHSSLPQLRRAARLEALKLSTLTPEPSTYRFVTSRRLTYANKRSLQNDLRPFVKRPEDIWGRDDLDLLLFKYPEVERRHIKLWLPSSPQLHAILHAGRHARSRAVVDDILAPLPRWVPSRAFPEAREILRREHVCIIAGVPGIGKTTLAKMLLADAIDDGYEAVHISADIEEAWSAYSPGAKQVFYYDDFLGRTVLTEYLGKNEEDRLLAFMRRASDSQTTLFILTTREYIFQQAQQLYEQLALQPLEGRKFLLRLAHYTRLERARIFCNHAFVSGQLNLEARRALLVDNAYAAIIDHPAYNPRQIEWITGLSGHRLTPSDNRNYLAFATAALADPARIWQYGFERQLTDSQRALLLAMATMPDRVEHNDLEVAFNRFCAVARLSTRNRAFEKSLRVLDDSFVRTYQDGEHIFISVHNPEIEDFLSSYLKDNATEARLALRGAIFFEQVQNLARLLRSPEIPSPAVASAFVAALSRCLQKPSCSWHGVYFGRTAKAPTTVRRSVSAEARATMIGRTLAWGPPYNRQPLRPKSLRLYKAAIALVVRDWLSGTGDKHDALALLELIRADSNYRTSAIAAAKKRFTSDLYYPFAFTYLIRLRALFPKLFDPTEWRSLQTSYLRIANRELSDWRDLDALDQVDDMERYGREMGVELDSPTLQLTRERVADRIAELEENAGEG
jgi:conflict system STAND superfamily ATPase/restriction endonuclease